MEFDFSFINSHIFQDALTSNQKHKPANAIKKDFVFASYRPQKWSLPDSIIYYITKNPSTSKCYQKMVQSCKYFYIKNPILILSKLYYIDDKWKTSIENRSLDLGNITYKIWIIKDFEAVNMTYNYPDQPDKNNLVLSIIPKIYQCNAKCLFFIKQIIFYSDLCFLSSCAEEIYFHKVTINNDDGSIVPLEKIFEAFPKVKRFCFKSDTTLSNIKSNTVKELLKLLNFVKLKKLMLNRIPEEFDIDTFYTYIKRNWRTRIELKFDGSISAAYKNKLNNIIDEIDEIINTTNFKYKPPLIEFH